MFRKEILRAVIAFAILTAVGWVFILARGEGRCFSLHHLLLSAAFAAFTLTLWVGTTWMGRIAGRNDASLKHALENALGVDVPGEDTFDII